MHENLQKNVYEINLLYIHNSLDHISHVPEQFLFSLAHLLLFFLLLTSRINIEFDCECDDSMKQQHKVK